MTFQDMLMFLQVEIQFQIFQVTTSESNRDSRIDKSNQSYYS
jgi:hypothetical protein